MEKEEYQVIMAAKTVKKTRKVTLTPEEAKIYKKRAKIVHLRHQVIVFAGLLGIITGLALSLITTHSIIGCVWRVTLCFISFSILGVIWGSVIFDFKKIENIAKKDMGKVIVIPMELAEVQPGMKIIAPIVSESGKTVLENSLVANDDNLLSLKNANVKKVNIEGVVPVSQ